MCRSSRPIRKPETLALAKAIAQNRAKELPADDSGLAGRRKLPADGMIADSVAFVPENAQGQAAFKDVFQAKYKFDGAELPFFIMVAAPDDAAKAWKSFQDFCGRFGKAENLPDVNGGENFPRAGFRQMEGRLSARRRTGRRVRRGGRRPRRGRSSKSICAAK